MRLGCPAASVVMALAVWIVGPLAAGSDITVNDTTDSLHASGCASTGTGICSLRDAITFANAHPGTDTIYLGGLTFRPASPLPAITEAVSIAGTGPPVYPPGAGGAPATLDGTLAGPSDGLVVAADGCVLLGMVIQNFQGSGLLVRGNANTLGSAVILPRDPDTTIDAIRNGRHGIDVDGGSGNVLRAVSAVENRENGIYFHGGAASNVVSDQAPVRQGWIASNGAAGIRIGADPRDTSTRSNTIGSLATNSGNGGLGIDLGGDCVTANDSFDADTGPNGLQNFPSVTSAQIDGTGTQVVVSGTFMGVPNATLAVRLYTWPDYAFFAQTSVVTDGGGQASFSYAAEAQGIPPNTPFPLVATATDGNGNTSEFSPGPAEAPPVGLSFYTLPPCRVLDTRTTPYFNLVGGRPRRVLVAGGCSLPLKARAVALNVTVTNATASGHLAFAGPAPRCGSSATSAINFTSGQTRANSAVLALDAAGYLQLDPTLTESGTVDLILDVTGYLQ